MQLSLFVLTVCCMSPILLSKNTDQHFQGFSGGAVDMFYFPNGIQGTGFATMELLEPDGSGPKPNRIGTYELVAFSKHALPAKEDKYQEHPFRLVALSC